MDLESTWKNNNGRDDDLEQVMARNFGELRSALPLKKLKTNLFLGIIIAVMLNMGYVVLLFFVSLWQVSLALAVMILFNTIILVDSWRLYKRTPSFVTVSNSVKQELLLHYTSFQRWWSVQQKMGLFVYPVAVAGGFILGGFQGSGKPVEAFLYNPRMLSILGVTILVFVPLCYYGARWMFNYAYGTYLKQLQTTIDHLE